MLKLKTGGWTASKSRRRRNARRTQTGSAAEILEHRVVLSTTSMLAPVVEGSILDNPRDGVPDSFDPSFEGLIRDVEPGGTGVVRENRAIIEFDAGTINQLTAADLNFTLSVNNAGGQSNRTVDVIVYAGNGSADLSDFDAVGTIVDTVSFLTTDRTARFLVDVRAEAQSIVASGNQYVGIRFDGHGPELFPTIMSDAELTITGDTVPTSITVDIDIRPRSENNRINLHSRYVQVAILSTTDFDATTQIDVSTLTFGATGDEASLSHRRPRFRDVNGDGLDDLVVKFRTRRTRFEVGDTAGILKGLTIDGTELTGSDIVNVWHPRKRGRGHHGHGGHGHGGHGHK